MSKVMVVDDEKDVVYLIKVLLEREKLEVLEAYNGLEAYNKLTSKDPGKVLPDAMILDIMMPEMNGDEFAERIREAGVNCPIIVMTGLLSPEEARHKNYRIGNRVVTGKPVPLPVLATLVHQALEA